jgi:hypothetical protein
LTAAGKGAGSASSEREAEDRGARTVALGVVGKDEIAEGNLDPHPLLVLESRPDVVWRRDRVLVGSENDLGLLVVDVDGTKEEDETGEGGVGRNRLEPVVVHVGEDHLRLTGAEDLWRGKRRGQ